MEPPRRRWAFLPAGFNTVTSASRVRRARQELQTRQPTTMLPYIQATKAKSKPENETLFDA